MKTSLLRIAAAILALVSCYAQGTDPEVTYVFGCDQSQAVKVNYYETDSLDSLPSKSMQENMHLPYKHECVSQIKFLKSYGIFAGSEKSNNFVAYFDGKLKFPAAGTWTMYLKSRDGSKLFIEGVEVVNNDGLHSEMVEKSGSIIVNKGSLIKRFRLEYFKGWEGENGLILKWEGPGYSKISPGAADFYVNPNTIILGSSETNIVIPNVTTTRYLAPYKDSLPENFDFLEPISYDSIYLRSIPGRPEDYAVVLEGYLNFPEAGEYTIFEYSDSDARMYVDNKLVLSVNGEIGFQSEGHASVVIDQPGGAVKPFRLEFLELAVGLGTYLWWDAPNSTDTLSFVDHLI